MAKIYGELEEAQVEQVGALPSGKKGQVVHLTTDDRYYHYDGTAWRKIVHLSSTDTLTNKTLTSPTITSPAMSGAVHSDEIVMDEIVTPSTPASGKRAIYPKADGKFYQLDDNGLEQELGAGGGAGGINYIDNDDFETDASGWTDSGGTMSIARATSPSFGSVLRGTASGEITNGANADYVDYAFTLHDADTSRVLKISFDYETDDNFVDGDCKLVLRDVTNSTDIAVVPEDIQAGKGTFSGYAQTSADGTSYELRIVQVAETGPWATMNIDNVSVGPAPRTFGPVVEDWEDITTEANSSYLPTGYGANLGTYSYYYRARVGDTLHVMFRYDHGAGAGTGTADLEFPFPGVTGDFTAGHLGTATTYNIDHAEGVDASFRTTGVDATATGWRLKRVGDTNQVEGAEILANAQIRVETKVKVQGWSSSQEQSSDSDTRVVAMRAERASTGFSYSITADIYEMNATVFDTHGAWDGTSVYTVPVSGYYEVSAGLLDTTVACVASERFILNLKIDGTVESRMAGLDVALANQDILLYGTSGPMYCTKGQTLEVEIAAERAGSTGSNGTQNYISIKRLSGPAQIAASEAVNFHVNLQSASQSVTDSNENVIEFDTVRKDTHGGYSTTDDRYNIPSSGDYVFVVNAHFAALASDDAMVIGIKVYDESGVEQTNYSSSYSKVGSFTADPAYNWTSMVVPCNKGWRIQAFVNSQADTVFTINNGRRTFFSGWKVS